MTRQLKCRAHFLVFCFLNERETGSNFLKPDILTSKCYIVRKVKFRNNLETVDVSFFGNIHYCYSRKQMLIFLLFISVFPQLYFHMIRQRKKIIGGKGKRQ